MADAPSEQDGSQAGREARSTSIGLYLGGQRRLRGISVDELAERTRIPRRNIERLEAGAFDRAPDGFSRGFVRTIAAALGLDPDEAVMRLMTEPVADDLGSGRGVQRIAVVVVLLALGSLGLALLWKLGGALLEAGARSPEAEIVYRRDAVRVLATEIPSEATALAAVEDRGDATRARDETGTAAPTRSPHVPSSERAAESPASAPPLVPAARAAAALSSEAP